MGDRRTKPPYYVEPLWDFWFWQWGLHPDDYYQWMAGLLSERAPA